MRTRDQLRAQALNAALLLHDAKVRKLPGVRDAKRRTVLIEQIVDSMRRVEYARVLPTLNLSCNRTDPRDAAFHPLKAAAYRYNRGEFDEAFWLVFLFIHFGRDRNGRWQYISGVYGQLGSGLRWDWANVHANLVAFRTWLALSEDALRKAGGGFGNHRKYVSLNAHSKSGTGAAVQSYVAWVAAGNGHINLIATAIAAAHGDPKRAFDILYRSMNQVASFGRTGRFDYLAMLGKLGFASIEPGKAYLSGATGPVKGANLLFREQKSPASPAKLDAWLVELDRSLGVGMQVLEDALCNWQKRPDSYVAFRG